MKGLGTRGWGLGFAVLSSAFVVLSSAAGGAQGRISNAKTETRSAAQGLSREVRAAAARVGVTWIAYRVPMIAGSRQMCCFDTISDTSFSGGLCRLESGGGVSMNNGDVRDRNGSRIVLEPATEFLVFARLEGGSVNRIRTFTPDCDVDAMSMPLVWLTDVNPDESVSWLASLMTAPPRTIDGDRISNAAMTAVALHNVPSALTTLITTARGDASAKVRGQALFWLAQRAGEQAVATINGALDNDPDTEVKKKAVFALSQLPRDEGVPKLMDVARNNGNPQVRKQAMFWLGQTHDPRAVKFFEEILLRK